jgi:hypothetical protein
MYQIHPNGIKSLLSALNANKTTEHDNISDRFLKELHQELTQALTKYQQSGKMHLSHHYSRREIVVNHQTTDQYH